MKYLLLLWPHANVRYRTVMQQLALNETTLLMRSIAADAVVTACECMGLPALQVESSAEIDPARFAMLSCLYGVMRVREDGALEPVGGREKTYLGEDLPGILKYKGKTNELFTDLLLNVALFSGRFAEEKQIRLLDPMCGKGTSLFVGLNRGWNVTGADIDKHDLSECETFFKRYLEYHHIKHQAERGSLTAKGHSAPYVSYTLADTPEHFKAKQTLSLRLVNGDATQARAIFGSGKFHIVAADLPYGVQHKPGTGTLEQLLERCFPAWKECLLPGGTIAVSFNAQTLKREKVWSAMQKAGLEVETEGVYSQFAHWVEQAVTRDIAVARRKG